MSTRSCSLAEKDFGAANWVRAALELRRSRRAASRVPLRGNIGRGSTGCAAAFQAGSAVQELSGSVKVAGGVRKPALEVMAGGQSFPAVRDPFFTSADQREV
ncbi:hypothetical protein NDU88_009022 [Pleurodeles waltl]|uniref:Uncharacterized protein n=1 Tax=Pleurodeles waltl TaxID=8319 RepID=A0AAV7QQI6_PLEWA|nr:hypothetical protein NDU88_009022 [Pleurodeles waltl]